MEVLWNNVRFCPLALLFVVVVKIALQWVFPDRPIRQVTMREWIFFLFGLKLNPVQLYPLGLAAYHSCLHSVQMKVGPLTTVSLTTVWHNLHFSTFNANLSAAFIGGPFATQDTHHPAARPGSLRLATLTQKSSFFFIAWSSQSVPILGLNFQSRATLKHLMFKPKAHNSNRQACSSHCNLDYSRIGRRQCCLVTPFDCPW